MSVLDFEKRGMSSWIGVPGARNDGNCRKERGQREKKAVGGQCSSFSARTVGGGLDAQYVSENSPGAEQHLHWGLCLRKKGRKSRRIKRKIADINGESRGRGFQKKLITEARRRRVLIETV